MRYLINGILNNSNNNINKKYIEFILPSRDDLFNGKFKNTKINEQSYNVYVLDVRLIITLLNKGDLRMLDVMYGKLTEKHIDAELLKIHTYIQNNREILLNDTKMFFLKRIIEKAKYLIESLDEKIDNKKLAELQKLYWIFYVIYRNESLEIVLTETNKKILKEIANSSICNVDFYINLKNKFEAVYGITLIKSGGENLKNLEGFMMKIIL